MDDQEGDLTLGCQVTDTDSENNIQLICHLPIDFLVYVLLHLYRDKCGSW